MKYITALCIIASFCFGTSAMATDYYVNPKGNNLWSRTLKEPNVQLTDGPFNYFSIFPQSIRLHPLPFTASPLAVFVHSS